MRRRLLWTTGAVVAVAVVATAALAAFGSFGSFGSFGGEGDVPTAEVRRGALERKVAADGVLQAATATPLIVPRESPGRLRIAWLPPEGTRLAAGDVAVRFDPTELERTLVDRQADLEANDFKRSEQDAQADARLGNLDRDTQVARRELEHATEFKSQDETIFSRNEIIESGIDQDLASERLDHARESRTREETIAGTEVAILGIERRKLQFELDRAQRAVAALEIRAPHDGFLIFERNWRGDPPRVGDSVYPGQRLAEIPRAGAMEVEAYVLEADAGGLVPGKRARVFLEAYPGRVHEGEVARVDSVAKPRHRSSPVQYFAVTLALDETDEAHMKPGQRVHAEIFLDRLDGVLTVPRQAVFENDGESVVYRQEGDELTPVPVAVGAATQGRVVVTGELQEGDRVALRDPKAPAAAPGTDAVPAEAGLAGAMPAPAGGSP